MTAQPALTEPVLESDPAAIIQKRKLSEIEADTKMNGTTPEKEQVAIIESAGPDPQTQRVIRDLFVVLSRHDTDPSILHYQLSQSSAADEPANKRARLSEDAQLTIANKVEKNGYASLRAFQADIDQICEQITKPIRESELTTQSISADEAGASLSYSSDLLAKVLAFQKITSTIIQDDATTHATKSETGIQINGTNVNGVKLETSDDQILTEGKPVLSIFANAQGSKQLFSSFQKDVRVETADDPESREFDASIEITLPINESSLPSFITLSTRSQLETAAPAEKRRLNFGERFGPPNGRTLPHLQVPKPSNKLMIKSGNVNWVSHESLAKAGVSRPVYNWPSMKQASGKWLSYSGISSSQDPKSPESKRRQRDRALSTGAANPPQSDESRLAEEHAKEEALFRSVFSSFAPCRDNSGAIISDHVKNEIWWERVGRQRAQNVFLDPVITEDADDAEVEEDFAEQDRMFAEAAENFDPALLPSLEEQQTQDDEVEAKLQEISNLIETLYSYQKIRISQLPTTSVPITPGGARQLLTDVIGTPDTPSAAEREVYKNLKTKLALAVLDLPPYAVAKLNGDKYGDLAVSTSILLETDDDAGIMEDESSRTQPKAVAAQAAAQSQASIPRPSAPNYGPHTNAGTQYGRTPAAAPIAGRGNSTYYPQQTIQPAARTPSISYPRTTGGATNYSGYSQSAARPTYPPATNSYSTPSRQTYNQPQYNGQQSQQGTTASRGNYNQYYQSSSQQGGYNRQYQQAPVPNYGQRPQPQQYGYTPQPTQSPNMRTASPMQVNAANPAIQYGRTPSAQPRTQFYGPPQASAIGPSGFHSSMTTAEQQMLIERQRVVAAQSNTRLSATPTEPQSHSPQRQVSGTPQPIPNYIPGQAQMNGNMGS